MSTDPSVTRLVAPDLSDVTIEWLDGYNQPLGLPNAPNDTDNTRHFTYDNVTIDTNEPIPFGITSKGRLAVLEFEMSRLRRRCHHEWTVIDGEVWCRLCDHRGEWFDQVDNRSGSKRA